ncbi:sensors of blue-light using FAD [Antarctobacter heliothermus]|uniref:Sensors of blue-light using FAD n=1 Tax=Antarctobacter heliothermus TaxID=74033 RepID=A0A222E8X2_9RHOB|nr:BLUF domain-containing protein [Antarctobacter heliothermus]ASP22663.1 sensors of blue-light using FAD [Antarctobacter heliothermus]
MKRLIYLSSAVRLATRDDLAQILGAARRNNRRDGVTGLLMYHDGTFLQILEGEETAVDRVFERIARNDLHRGVQSLPSSQVHERLFADWTMAFARPDALCVNDDLGAKAFVAVRQDLDRIEASDKRAATFVRRFFSTFRDLGSLTGR